MGECHGNSLWNCAFFENVHALFPLARYIQHVCLTFNERFTSNPYLYCFLRHFICQWVRGRRITFHWWWISYAWKKMQNRSSHLQALRFKQAFRSIRYPLQYQIAKTRACWHKKKASNYEKTWTTVASEKGELVWTSIKSDAMLKMQYFLDFFSCFSLTTN